MCMCVGVCVFQCVCVCMCVCMSMCVSVCESVCVLRVHGVYMCVRKCMDYISIILQTGRGRTGCRSARLLAASDV
jgi:hypothetical protein